MLHERVARRWRWSALERAAGGGALAGSLAGWLLGLTAPLHLGLMLVLALLAVAAVGWRSRLRGDERAFAWISAQVGLAYETAWNLRQRQAAGGVAEALAEATRIQGRLSIRDLQPPPPTAWWLPLLTAATCVWLWALFAGSPIPGLSERWGPAPAGAPADLSQPLLPDGEGESQLQDDASLAPEVADTDAAERDATVEPVGAPVGGVGGDTPAGDGRAAERDTFERFLERLRERPPTEPDPTASSTLASDAEPETDEPTPGMPGRDEGRAQDPLAPPTADPPRAAADNEAPPEDAAASPEAGTGEGEEAALEEAAADGEASELGESPEPGSEADGEREGAGEGTLTEGPTGLEEGDETESQAGLGASNPGATDPLEGVNDGDPQALPSLLGSGPELPVGGVRLPGVPPSDGVPAGAAALGYQRAVERALLEGDLPAPYQEVIRSYFR